MTDGRGTSVDTEDADVEYVEINGNEAMMIQKGTEIQIVWPVYNNAGVIAITGIGISEDEILRVANQLDY